MYAKINAMDNEVVSQLWSDFYHAFDESVAGPFSYQKFHPAWLTTRSMFMTGKDVMEKISQGTAKKGMPDTHTIRQKLGLELSKAILTYWLQNEFGTRRRFL